MATFQLVDTPARADGVVIIDVSNLAHRAAWAHKMLTTSAGRFSGHVFGSLQMLLACFRNDLPAGRWCPIYAYDGPDAKATRQVVAPAYKANRGKDGRPNPVPEVEAVLRLLPGLHIKAPGREGDDAIAWAVTRCDENQVMIWSGDRDLWALIRGTGVQVYSPNLKRVVTTEDLTKAYGVDSPFQVPLAKALFGDPSDGIKGVERLQKKQAALAMNASVIGPFDFYGTLKTGRPIGMSENTYTKLLAAEAQVHQNYAVIQSNITGFESGLRRTRILPEVQAAFRAAVLEWQCSSILPSIQLLFGSELQRKEES